MEKDLARELREAGVPAPEAADLADLAAEIEGLPEVRPRRGWLHESKWRLLRKFDERRAGRAGPAEDAEGQE